MNALKMAEVIAAGERAKIDAFIYVCAKNGRLYAVDKVITA